MVRPHSPLVQRWTPAASTPSAATLAFFFHFYKLPSLPPPLELAEVLVPSALKVHEALLGLLKLLLLLAHSYRTARLPHEAF